MPIPGPAVAVCLYFLRPAAKSSVVSAYPTFSKKNGHRKRGVRSFWGGRWDSNPRSSVPQTDALGQLRYTHHILARLKGLEPLAPCLEGRCSIQLSYRRILIPQGHKQIGAGDGNRTHTTSLEGWGSTTELHPHISCLHSRRSHSVDYHTTRSLNCQALISQFCGIILQAYKSFGGVRPAVACHRTWYVMRRETDIHFFRISLNAEGTSPTA